MTAGDSGSDPSLCLVLTTESDRASADRLAAELIGARAAACVSMFPLASTYRWEGEIEVANEVQLLIKTDETHVADVAELIREHHTYDLPEVVVLRGDAGEAYGRWVGSELS